MVMPMPVGSGVALADGGETVVTGSRDGSVKIWDRASGRQQEDGTMARSVWSC